ncbi:MAG TPA: hypothetical protein V6C65_40275 [Allocoleopsis sp.]
MPPAPPPAPSPSPVNSAIPYPVDDGGNSEPDRVQLDINSAIPCPVNDGGNYRQTVRVCRSHSIPYYRYRCTRGRQIIHDLHIPGGDIDSERVIARAAEVNRWINLGRSPDQIVSLIESWGDLPS